MLVNIGLELIPEFLCFGVSSLPLFGNPPLFLKLQIEADFVLLGRVEAEDNIEKDCNRLLGLSTYNTVLVKFVVADDVDVTYLRKKQ
jgi:hypothetical protein